MRVRQPRRNETPQLAGRGAGGADYGKRRDLDLRSLRAAALLIRAITPEQETCEHERFEEFLEPAKRGRQRIVAICPDCNALATRLWITALGDNLGWIWPQDEEAYRAWKRRQAGGSHG